VGGRKREPRQPTGVRLRKRSQAAGMAQPTHHQEWLQDLLEVEQTVPDASEWRQR